LYLLMALAARGALALAYAWLFPVAWRRAQ
jgi:hypothetical protein